MSNVIIKTTNDQLNQMKAYYRSYLLNRWIPYTIFAARRGGTTITAYISGKVMLQGVNAETEARRRKQAQDKQAKPTRTVSSLSKSISQLFVLGSDGVGNGSYFGLPTVRVAYVKRDQLVELRKLDVRDLGELKDSRIIQPVDILKETILYRLLVLLPEKYNEIQPKYSVVRMKVALHNQVIHLLLKKTAPKKSEAILVDQFTPEADFKKYARSGKNHLQEKLYFITKGGQCHLAVAVISITSRASFLEELDKASAKAGITLPPGAGAKSDQIAAELLEKGGMSMLEKYAKPRFANTEEALNLLKK